MIENGYHTIFGSVRKWGLPNNSSIDRWHRVINRWTLGVFCPHLYTIVGQNHSVLVQTPGFDSVSGRTWGCHSRFVHPGARSLLGSVEGPSAGASFEEWCATLNHGRWWNIGYNSASVCMYIYVYIYMYIYMYIHDGYIYIHIHHGCCKVSKALQSDAFHWSDSWSLRLPVCKTPQPPIFQDPLLWQLSPGVFPQTGIYLSCVKLQFDDNYHQDPLFIRRCLPWEKVCLSWRPSVVIPLYPAP